MSALPGMTPGREVWFSTSTGRCDASAQSRSVARLGRSERLAVPHPTPSWRASQACSGGSAGLEPPDALGAGAILFSQHSGHSTCGRPCRPFSCSDAKYAAPATSTKVRPPPKGRPGALGMGRGIAVHLSIDKGGAIGADRREPAPSSVTPLGRIACKTWRRCPRPSMWSASRVLAFHHTGGADFRRLTRRHGHVIPELLRVSQAYATRQLIPDTEELAVHKNPEGWLERRAAAGTAGGNVGAVGAGSRVTLAAGRPRHSHRPPARSRWPGGAGPIAPGRWCAIPAGTSRPVLSRA